MSVKKKSYIILITLLIVMLILPLVSVRLVSSDVGMALLIVLFLILNPATVIVLSIMAGTDIKKLWWTPVLSAVVFPVFCAIVFEETVVELLVYSGLYLGIGAVAMLGSFFGNRMKQRRK